jgi:hypothetical protein
VILRLIIAIACGAVLVLAAGGATVAQAGEDSAWPHTNALKPNVRALRHEVARLSWEVERMEESAEHAEDWVTCIKYVPVNELGDRDRQSGYLYDERDGTGVGHMDGIAVDRRRKAGKEDYLFMDFRGSGCHSDNPQPGGTAEPASVRRPSLRQELTMLEHEARRLAARSQRLETISERFDEWESCVSWVPVTELGDPDERFGYLFGPQGGDAGYRSALHIDRSDWDDPDYMFLALVGGDRPGRECQDEPGEAVD